METGILHKLFLQSTGISTDTRNLENGQLFFALSGENFNGNQFVNQALEKGAAYCIIDDEKFNINKQCILVDNVLECMQTLGQFHRSQLGIPVIAITGSNGKTTTKELISRVLSQKYKISCTQGNLNNHIGVPLTLLSFNSETQVGIVEMGANHQNEIEKLCEIALPDFGIINNIGKAHLEGFGSYEGVIKAKSELYSYCKNNNKTVFVNGKDELLMKLSGGMNRITYGTCDVPDNYAEFESSDPFLAIRWKDYVVQTQLVGEYNFNNVLASIAVGNYFNIPENDIVTAISNYYPQNNRSQLTKTEKNTLIIDAYNANPSSMELSVRNFTNIKGENKLLIIGDMFELGETSDYEHKRIVDLVQELNFFKVYFVGNNFLKLKMDKPSGFHFFKSVEDLGIFLVSSEIKDHFILLKASRGIKLEKIIEFL